MIQDRVLKLITVIELSGVQFWAEIIRMISKSNECPARVRFEIISWFEIKFIHFFFLGGGGGKSSCNLIGYFQ